MKILIVEDDQVKLAQIIKFLNSNFTKHEINKKYSFQSGLKEIISSNYDLIILDMSMPTYDISSNETGGRTRAYAGKEILKQMIRRNITVPVIVVTQFDTFGDVGNTTTLQQLNQELQVLFNPLYIGTVYYNSTIDSWKEDLYNLIMIVNKGGKKDD